MLAKSLKKIDMRPTALVPVITRMWRAIEPVTNRGGTGIGSASDAVDGLLAGMGSLSAVLEPSATHKLQHQICLQREICSPRCAFMDKARALGKVAQHLQR